MKVYNVGIIGYGGMGEYHHHKIHKPDYVKFIGAFDIDKNRNQKAMASGLKVYQSIGELLSDDNIDIILIATPNHVHKEIAVAAMNKGKHVVCEKPVALNSGELQEMILASQKNHVVFTVHQNRRMDKDYRIIRKIYSQNLIGDLFRIESRVQGSRGIANTWRRKKEYGGGMLYDWGVHLIDQLLYMIPSEVVSIYAEMQYLSQDEVDDNVRLTMCFKNGVSALVEIGTCNYIMLPRWYMCCREGTAQIDYWDLKGKIIKLKNMNMKWEDEIPSSMVGPSRTFTPRSEDTIEFIDLPEPDTDEGIFYRNFINAIEGKEELFVKPSEVMRTTKLLDLAFQSAEKNQVMHCMI